MHPHTRYEIMNARVADLRREGDQARLARAVAQARRAQRRHGDRLRLPRLGVLAPRLLCVPRRWQPSRRTAG